MCSNSYQPAHDTSEGINLTVGGIDTESGADVVDPVLET